MLNNVLREGKGMIIFLLMFVIFTYFAIIRVDHIESSNFNHKISNEIVYNR